MLSFVRYNCHISWQISFKFSIEMRYTLIYHTYCLMMLLLAGLEDSLSHYNNTEYFTSGNLYVILLFECREGRGDLCLSFKHKDDTKIAATAGGKIRIACHCCYYMLLLLLLFLLYSLTVADTGLFTWTPPSLDVSMIEIVATDDFGASSLLAFKVRVCQCSNGGVCNFDILAANQDLNNNGFTVSRNMELIYWKNINKSI